MTAQHNPGGQEHRGASPKTCVIITSLTWPLFTQPVSSAFRLSSYFLASTFRMTILFLKWTNSSGHNSLKRNTTKFKKIMQENPKVFLSNMSHEQNYKRLESRGWTSISPSFLVCKPNRMVNSSGRPCSETKQEVNKDGQREGRGVRREKGRNRNPGPSTEEGRWKDCPITESERGSVLRGSGAFRPVTGKHRPSGGRLSREGATLFWKESTGNFQRSDASD